MSAAASSPQSQSDAMRLGKLAAILGGALIGTAIAAVVVIIDPHMPSIANYVLGALGALLGMAIGDIAYDTFRP